jgi:uncharacterized protein
LSGNFHPLHTINLPIFRKEQGAETWFYTPGYLIVVDAEQANDFESDLIAHQPARQPAAAELRRCAELAQQAWTQNITHPFNPLCLTLYLNNFCNLHCSYCYSEPRSHSTRNPQPPRSDCPPPGDMLSDNPHSGNPLLAPGMAQGNFANHLALPVIRAAAEMVIENCAAQQRTFTVAFHGGGEPTLDQPLIDQTLDYLEPRAAASGLSIFRYIATNGVMSAAKAAWLARRFDLIGLSCDGPETIQLRQRPLSNGNSSTPFVERTARAVLQAGKPLHVRVTITPAGLHSQAKIADYICQRLKPQAIHVEPVYMAGLARAENCIEADQAEDFVAEFLQACHIARQYGVGWYMSGSRPGEIHGPYCHIFRDVLNLTPEGTATACFKFSRAAHAHQQGMQIGQMNVLSGRFALNQTLIQHLRQRLTRPEPKCLDCFNQYHCVRDCPNQCLAAETQSTADNHLPGAEFRCRVQALLVLATIQETAQSLRANRKSTEGAIGGCVIL